MGTQGGQSQRKEAASWLATPKPPTVASRGDGFMLPWSTWIVNAPVDSAQPSATRWRAPRTRLATSGRVVTSSGSPGMG